VVSKAGFRDVKYLILLVLYATNDAWVKSTGIAELMCNELIFSGSCKQSA
jgi:hypothetical protein